MEQQQTNDNNTLLFTVECERAIGAYRYLFYDPIQIGQFCIYGWMRTPLDLANPPISRIKQRNDDLVESYGFTIYEQKPNQDQEILDPTKDKRFSSLPSFKALPAKTAWFDSLHSKEEFCAMLTDLFILAFVQKPTDVRVPSISKHKQ